MTMSEFLSYEKLHAALLTQKASDLARLAQNAEQLTDEFKRNLVDCIIRRKHARAHLDDLFGNAGLSLNFSWDMDMRPTDPNPAQKIFNDSVSRPHRRETVLAFAVGLRKIDVVKHLLDMGAPVEVKPNEHHPLHALLHHVHVNGQVPLRLLNLLHTRELNFNDRLYPIAHSVIERGTNSAFPLEAWLHALEDRGMAVQATEVLTGDTTTHRVIEVINRRRHQVDLKLLKILTQMDLEKDIHVRNFNGQTPRDLAKHVETQQVLLAAERSVRALNEGPELLASQRRRCRP
jgi:hypothetical protein